MRPLIRQRAHWAVAGLALVVVATTARLGWWQLQRAEQKQTLGQQRQAQQQRPALTEASAATWQRGDVLRRVTLQGRWLDAHTVYLDNRQMQGQPGFFVLTPLQVAPDRALVVQRGWVARNFEDRTRLPPVTTPGGLVSVQGRLAMPPSALLALGSEGRSRLRQNLNWDDYQQQVGLALGPLSVQQIGELGDGLQRQWYQPDDKVSMHHGYAFQWFALSVLTAVWYGWFYVNTRNRRKQQRR